MIDRIERDDPPGARAKLTATDRHHVGMQILKQTVTSITGKERLGVK